MIKRNQFTHQNALFQVRQIINESLFQKSFRKYVQKTVTQNALRKIPSDSINYVNSLMKQIVKKECMRPSYRTSQSQQKCPSINQDHLKVMTEKINRFRNSSINFGSNQKKIRKSLRLTQIFSTTQTDQILQTASKNNIDSMFLKQKSLRKTKKFNKHSRTSTQVDFKNSSFLGNTKQSNLFPINNVDNLSNNQNKATFQNRQLDCQIDALRTRKLKLQAAFSSFDDLKALNLQKQNKRLENELKTKLNTKKSQQFILKSVITNYDGEILSNLPVQKMKKIGINNKQNCFKNNATPIVRIKTEIASNYLELTQNKKSYKPSTKYISHNVKDTDKFSFQNSQCSSSAAINKNKVDLSILDIKDDPRPHNNYEPRKKYRKSNQQSLFNIDDFAKSKRVIQRQMKSRKNIQINN